MSRPLTPAYAAKLTERLDSGERLLWWGRPRQGLLLRGADAFVIPFSLVWTGFACFWEAMVLRMAGPGRGPVGSPVGSFMALFGLPFIAIGLYLLVGRFFVDAAARRWTEYGVTDRRAIIIGGLFTRTTTSIDLRAAGQVDLVEHRDGTGTIMFGTYPVFPFGAQARMFQGMHWPGMPTLPSFERVPDVAEAYRLIRSVQHGQLESTG